MNEPRVIASRFTAPGRSMAEEDRIVLTSVGVDIGSSTSHLLFSRLELEREDSRYVTTSREVLHESDILLTPYRDGNTIDEQALGRFVSRQYAEIGIRREEVDTGALILTGVALLRRNARAIAEMFAADTGRFVAVSAGDNLEATMAAHGSGAVQLSARAGAVMNIDMGGGTTKIAICRQGEIAEIMTMDIGARLVAHDAAGVITRLEATGRAAAQRAGLDLEVGARITPDQLRAVAGVMVDALVKEVQGSGGGELDAFVREDTGLQDTSGLDAVTFSGGVSEFVYDRASATFGDLGPYLAEALQSRSGELGAPVVETGGGIRATVIGASQYTVQVSGSTLFVAPLDAIPVRNVPVVVPRYDYAAEPLDDAQVRRAVEDALRRLDLVDVDGPVAIATPWAGSATYARLRAFCTGVRDATAGRTGDGTPLILVFSSDVGGLIGLHLRDELGVSVPIVSVDGIDGRELDFIDIGELIPSSGAVPVVVKSLVFSTPGTGVEPTIDDRSTH